jgi:hypothetical protein
MRHLPKRRLLARQRRVFAHLDHIVPARFAATRQAQRQKQTARHRRQPVGAAKPLIRQYSLRHHKIFTIHFAVIQDSIRTLKNPPSLFNPD